jgi:hypothetical protein
MALPPRSACASARKLSAPHLAELKAWLREERSRLSRSASTPIDYMLKRWDRFTRFIDDGRICFTNNAAERALRGFALGANPGCLPPQSAVPIGPRYWPR